MIFPCENPLYFNARKERGIYFAKIPEKYIKIYAGDYRYQIAVIDRIKNEIAIESPIFLKFFGTAILCARFVGALVDDSGKCKRPGWLGLDMGFMITVPSFKKIIETNVKVETIQWRNDPTQVRQLIDIATRR